MKAIAKTRPEHGVEIVDVPVPKPGPGELLVKVAACGICGSDLHIYLWELGAERALPSMPAAIFAVGRAAGWIAHSLEQYANNRLIRPRMRYRGSPLRHWI